MSREIVNDHPFTDEEIEYLEGRRRVRDIALNQKMFPRGQEAESSAPKKIQLSPEIFEYVKGLSDEELDSEISKYGLDDSGEPKERKQRLAVYLQEKSEQE